jgi:hydroxypyruvate isomerase
MQNRVHKSPNMNRSSSAYSTSAPLLNRRQMLSRAAAWAIGTATVAKLAPSSAADVEPVARRGRIKHSIVEWPFTTAGDKWSMERLCQVAKQLGCLSVELVPAKYYPVLKQFGLTCAIGQIDMSPDPPFVYGFNNPDHWPRVMKATTDAIDAAAAFGVPSVICFTGYAARNPKDPKSRLISPERGARNCVEGLKKMVGYAERKGVTLCLEMLNSRVTDHPMKGHPGYQGDHTDYCIDIIQRVSSPRLKLLFDVYHVQIMDGDIIRRIRQYHAYIGHVHIAGVPGRGEPDATQEINYPPIMRTLIEVGYQGYVGQEFIPTRDPLQGLREAVSLCDV